MKTEFTKTGYSKDFNFFLQHQIFIAESNGLTKYCSCLESKTFLTDSRGKTPSQMIEKCREIHGQIINN